jgi:hypothetical protein
VLRGSTVDFAGWWKSPPQLHLPHYDGRCAGRLPQRRCRCYRSAAAAAVIVVIFSVVQALTGAGPLTGAGALTVIVLTLLLARRRLTTAYETGRQDCAAGDSPAAKDHSAHPRDAGRPGAPFDPLPALFTPICADNYRSPYFVFG